MRIPVALSLAAALAAIAIGSSGEAFARSRGQTPVVRDHRTTSAPVIRDHRATPVIRDHRTPATVVRRVTPAPRKVIRAGRNYDKTPNRAQAIVNGKRVPRRVEGGPLVRDHRAPTPVVRDHRQPTTVVRDHRVVR